MSAESSNAICSRLGIPVPRLEDVLRAQPKTSLFRLMVLTLLERGEPMGLEAIADRMIDAGVDPPSGDMVLSLTKAWHGLAPVYRDRAGKMALDAGSQELDDLVVFDLRLKPLYPPLEPLPPPPPEPSDEAPLTREEVAAACGRRSSESFSKLRLVAAILDAEGRPMSVPEIADRLDALFRGRIVRFDADTVFRWNSSLVRPAADARLLHLDRGSHDLRVVRRMIREIALPQLARDARDAAFREVRARREAAERLDGLGAEAAAASLRRAIIRAAPDSGPPRALAVLDANARTIRTFAGDEEIAAAREHLKSFDLVAGLGPRDTLLDLGLDPDRWRRIDLSPPRKTRLLNRSGRKLAITPALVISGTTRISRPLGDDSRVAEYLLRGETTKLRRRLASDVKSLLALYTYGVLHGCVRLRWGFLDEFDAVEWAEKGDRSAYAMLEEAKRTGGFVDVVFDHAPGFENPWARALRCEVLDVDQGEVRLRAAGVSYAVSRREIQALRAAPLRARD